MNERQLLTLKENIDSSKEKLAELKGRKQALMEGLKEKWGCDSITQAEKKIKKAVEEISLLEEKKLKGIKELEENYEL